MHGEAPTALAGAGRRLDFPGAEQSASLELAFLRRQINDFFSLHNVSRLISSAAAGSDLLLISEAMSRGLECDIHLPFRPERFRTESVIDRGEAWGALFDTALTYEFSNIFVVPETLEDPFIATNVSIVNRLDSIVSKKSAVAIWEKRPRTTMDYTANFVQLVQLRGIQLYEISPEAHLS
jgi:hypothetical protein